MTKKIARRQSAPAKAKLPTALDLFSGCGGLTLGLTQAGFNVIGAIELDDAAAAAYDLNHPKINLFHTDIRKVSVASVMTELNLIPGQLDLLAGCPPCQGFSSLRTWNGAKRNRDKRNNLVREMLRFARVLKPKSIMMENVPRLAGHKSFKDLCAGLRKLGYDVAYEIKDAADFYVPQRRRRLILLAGHGFKIDFAKNARASRTVRQAIGGLSDPTRSRDLLHKMAEKERAGRIQKLIRDIPKNGGSRGDLPFERQLKCHQRTDGFNDVYGRMAWNAVSPTITSGCFNPSKGRFLHPEEDRAITMREAALLQGFPANYKFDTRIGKVAIALMIGNALPPEFIRRHAAQIRHTLSRHALKHAARR